MGDDLKPYLDPYARPRWLARPLDTEYESAKPEPCMECGRDVLADGSCPVCDEFDLNDDGEPDDLLEMFPHVEGEASEEKYPE